MDNEGASNPITEIVKDGEKGDIIMESEVIVSFSSNSAESKYAVDQVDGATRPLIGSVACDRFGRGSNNIVLADEKSTSDQGGDGNGRIELVLSCDHGSTVSGSLIAKMLVTEEAMKKPALDLLFLEIFLTELAMTKVELNLLIVERLLTELTVKRILAELTVTKLPWNLLMVK